MPGGDNRSALTLSRLAFRLVAVLFSGRWREGLFLAFLGLALFDVHCWDTETKKLPWAWSHSHQPPSFASLATTNAA